MRIIKEKTLIVKKYFMLKLNGLKIIIEKEKWKKKEIKSKIKILADKNKINKDEQIYN